MPLQKIFFLAIAGGLVWEALKQVRRVLRARRSDSWPAVEGTIRLSEPFAKRSRAGHGRNHGHVYIPLIRYTYQVRGREYESEVITYGNEPLYTSWPERAQRKCDRYPVGSTQRVYVDPEDPSIACLERGGSRAFLGYGWSILFALLALGVVVGLVLR